MEEAQVWTLIGVLVASQVAQLGIYFHLRSRIDAFGADLDADINRPDAKLDDHTRFHAG